MNIELFQEFCRIIRPAFFNGIHDSDFDFEYDMLRFLLCDTEVDNLTDRYGERLYAGKLRLDRYYKQSYPSLLQKNAELTFDDLARFIKCPPEKLMPFEDDLQNLCEKHHIFIHHEQGIKEIYRQIFRACIYEKPECLFASYKNKQFKPSTLRSTVGFSDAAANLLTQLNEHPKVIISSGYGDGKTHFIKYCLTTWKLKDYYYINYQSDLSSTLNEISMYSYDGLEKKGCNISELSDPVYSSSLLVIDHMNDLSHCQDELKMLASLAVKVVVLTIDESTIDGFYSFPFPKLDENKLKLIFENNTSIQITDKHTWNHIKNVTGNNPLIQSLLMGQFNAILKTGTKSPTDTLNDLLISLEKKHQHLPPELNAKFKNAHDPATKDILGHFRKIYSLSFATQGFDPTLRKLLFQLCCFGHSPIPEVFCEKVLSEYSFENIRELAKRRFLSIEQGNIIVSPLIVYCVIAEENPQPKGNAKRSEIIDTLNNLQKNLLEYLISYNKALDVPFLGTGLYCFITTFYSSIEYTNNMNQEKTSNRFENWQELIYAVYNYYYQTGEYYYAEKILNQFYYPGNMQNKHNLIDQLYFFLGILSQSQNSVNETVAFTDILSTKLCEHSSSNSEWEHLLFFALDTAIGLYCFSLISLDGNSYRPRLEKYSYVVEHLIKYLPTLQESTSFSELRLFYQTFYSLLTKPNITFHDFDHYFAEIKKWNYMDYRIRGIALLIILQSMFIYHSKYDSLEKKYRSFDEALTTPLKILTADIASCKLIPIHTFRLCIYAYIAFSMVLFSLKEFRPDTDRPLQLPFNFSNLQHLFSCNHMSSEEYDAASTGINNIFKLLME